MSFDIFLQCFRNDEEAPIPRKVFDAIFAPHDTHPHLRHKDPGYMGSNIPTRVVGRSIAADPKMAKTRRG